MSKDGKQRTFEEMIEALHKVFAHDRIEIEEVEEIMASYHSSPEDWEKFAFLDPHKYTRNLVDDGNGKFNLMLLAWNIGHASSIHDHAGSHCFMKVLGGEVDQELYSKPADVLEGEEMKMKSLTTHQSDQVLYISDEIGLHRILNSSHVEPAFTLHLYSPPYKTCRAYDERTGKPMLLGCLTFFSRGGVKLEPMARAM